MAGPATLGALDRATRPRPRSTMDMLWAEGLLPIGRQIWVYH